MDLVPPFVRRVVRRTGKSNPKVHELCREDQLRKKSSSGGLKVKKRVRFELNEPTFIQSQRDDDDAAENQSKKNSEIISQVKILMTKEEAARFLSKCKDGGILELKDA
ncbi:hypothetical protein ACS0TY_012131 [Phlomoides rotata]